MILALMYSMQSLYYNLYIMHTKALKLQYGANGTDGISIIAITCG